MMKLHRNSANQVVALHRRRFPSSVPVERRTPDDEWPKLIPLDAFEAPAIPEDILPGWVGDFTRELARAIQVPYTYCLATVLGAVSLAVSSVVRCIRIRQGYREPLNLYILAPLPPGERKSAIVSAACAPIYEWESEQESLQYHEIQTALSRRRSQEKTIESKRRRAAKLKDKDDRDALIEEIASDEACLIDVPPLPRFLVDDITPEKLADLIGIQQGVVGIITSEGGIFDLLGGRYSRNGIPNLDLFLKAHSAEPYRVDRVGRESVMLKEPQLVVCVCPQPVVMRTIIRLPGFQGRGVLARFLYLLSSSSIGFRDINPDPIEPRVMKTYTSRMKQLLTRHGNMSELTLSSSARSKWLDFAGAVEQEMRPGCSLEHFTDWAGKLPGQAARLAGIFHCIGGRFPLDLEVSGDTMHKVITLTRYLVDHARVAFSLMSSDSDIEVARVILRWIKRTSVREFTVRECFRDLDGRYKKTTDIMPGLTVLTERGYLMNLGEMPTGGRPRGPVFKVNPVLSEIRTSSTDKLCSKSELCENKDKSGEMILTRRRSVPSVPK